MSTVFNQASIGLMRKEALPDSPDEDRIDSAEHHAQEQRREKRGDDIFDKGFHFDESVRLMN
jgi:hypothetical protein